MKNQLLWISPEFRTEAVTGQVTLAAAKKLLLDCPWLRAHRPGGRFQWGKETM